MRLDTIYICPWDDVPDGRMVDPEIGTFWVSWQWYDVEASDGGLVEDVDIVGAAQAVAWARQRADRVLFRLGHTEDTFFSAGVEVLPELHDKPLPQWPPMAPPAQGWWTPSDP